MKAYLMLLSVFYICEALESGGTNVCSRLVSRPDPTTVSYAESYSQVYYTTCGIFGLFRCTKTRTNYRRKYRTEEIIRYRTTFECCDGWSETNGQCITPICEAACQNGGICTAPNTCDCPSGYGGNRCHQDVNECSHNNGGCEDECHNTRGSYYCTCPIGFILDTNGRTCSDHDECSVQHDCQHVCNNVHGSYICSCNHGYSLMENSKSCEDIDECALYTDNDCDHICHNFDGSYNCTCQEGYATTDDGRTCQPICTEGCANGGHCIIPDVCACADGFDGESCQYKLNPWTHNATGCMCYFDQSRFDCACCIKGGCQCTWDHPHRCVQCGQGLKCDKDVSPEEQEFEVDGWTFSSSGCPCIYDNTKTDCACCQNGGCPCGLTNPKKCSQCGLVDGCL